MRRASSRVNWPVAPPDAIEVGAFLPGSEHALFDLHRFRAPIMRNDGDHSVAYFKPA
jgi:hypothetical protein